MEIVLIVVGIFVLVLIFGSIDNNRPVESWSDSKLVRMHGKLLYAARTAQEAGNSKQAAERIEKAAEVEREIRRRTVGMEARKIDGSLAMSSDAAPSQSPDEHECKRQFNLAQTYRLGSGVQKDTTKAYKIIRDLAEGGYVDAQNMLGFMLGNGEGVEKNEDEQQKWLLVAAESGHAIAQSNLGVLLATKESKHLNYSEAEKWLTRAAEQGEDFAQERLAEMYCNGEGVKQDYEKAEKWCRLAAAQGSFTAEHMLGVIRFQRQRDA